MDHTLEYIRQNIWDDLSEISNPKILKKVDQFIKNIRKKELKKDNMILKYISTIEEKTDLKIIADSQKNDLKYLENYNGNIFEGEDLEELAKMLNK